ncbi:MAG: sugar transferase, partial [Colwellia sp.]
MKRIFDIMVSLTCIIILSPISLIVVFLIRKNLGKPVLFEQSRPGQNGVLFQMMKFRTMLDATDEQGGLLPDEQRMTIFGNF